MSGKFIQSRREALGLTQKQFAELYNVNFRILQDYEQGRKPVESIKGDVLLRISKGLGCSIEDILLEDISMISGHNQDKYLKEYNKRISRLDLYGKYYRFPVIVDNEYVDMSRVHPLKQELVSRINNDISSDANVVSIMLFGSSVTMRCNKDSDIDLAIRLKEEVISDAIKNNVSEKIQEISDWKADILWYDRLTKDERIYHDICRGVQIV